MTDTDETFASRLGPAAAKRRVDTLQRIADEETRHRTQHTEWLRSWHLSLAVGNGAGLLGVSAILFADTAADWRKVLVGAAWCFTAGLIAGGLLAPLTAWRHYWAAEFNGEALRMMKMATVEPNKVDKLIRWIETIKWSMRACEPVAAISFLLGLVVPLASLTLYGQPR